MLLNNYTQAVVPGISAGATSLQVALPPGVVPTESDYLVLTLYDDADNIEIVHCTDVTGTTLTIVRGQEGTAARAWASGTPLASRATAQVLKDLGNVGGVLTSAEGVKSNLVTLGSLGATVTVSGSPSTLWRGGCWDGVHYWMYFNGDTVLVQFDTDMVATGVTLSLPSEASGVLDVTYLAGHFYVANSAGELLKIDESDGSLVETFTGWQWSRGLTTFEGKIHGTDNSTSHAVYDPSDDSIVKTNWAQTMQGGLATLGGGLVGVINTRVHTLVGEATVTMLHTTHLGNGMGLVGNNVDTLWGIGNVNANIRPILPGATTVIKGANVGTILRVGDAVGSTTVSSVDSANQVTLNAAEATGAITVTRSPTNDDLVTSLGGVTVWR